MQIGTGFYKRKGHFGARIDLNFWRGTAEKWHLSGKTLQQQSSLSVLQTETLGA